jgi:protein TonB
MPQHRFVTLASVALHTIALIALLVAQLLAVGPLPVPREPLMFDDVQRVHITDVSPSPPPQRSMPNTTSISPNAPPLEPPNGIIKETGLEGVTVDRSIDSGLVVEHGVESFAGEIAGVAPPPPPPSQPPQPIRLHSGMQAPVKIVDVTPQYPPLAQAAHVEGVVILEAVIDTDGRVAAVKVLRSIPLLDEAALKAVRAWRFTPARLNGQTVPVVMTVTVNFALQPYR